MSSMKDWLWETKEWMDNRTIIKNLSYSMIMAPGKASKKGHNVLFPEEKPVLFESVRYPFVIYGIVMGIAFVVFVLELYYLSVSFSLFIDFKFELCPSG